MASDAQQLRTTQRELFRFVQFATVGGIGTILDFSILIFLKELYAFPTLLANSISYSAGLVNNFTLNRTWTYADAREKSPWLQFVQFFAVSIMGLSLNSLLVWSLETPFSVLLDAPDSGYIAAKVLATGVVVFWNFFANRLWTFNDVDH